MKNSVISGIVFIVLAGLISACQTVKPYQRKYLNDASMQFGQKSVASFENTAHSIREGASSGQTKSTGGCGCN